MSDLLPLPHLDRTWLHTLHLITRGFRLSLTRLRLLHRLMIGFPVLHILTNCFPRCRMHDLLRTGSPALHLSLTQLRLLLLPLLLHLLQNSLQSLVT
jgi:hypothetical protein